MSVLVEVTGAQLVPDLRDPRAKRNGWIASQCADADHRTTQPVYAAIARDELRIYPDAASIHMRSPEEEA